MSEVVLEGKTKEEALNKALQELNANESEIIYHITEEERGKLFKGTIYKIYAITLSEATQQIKEYLMTIVTNLGIHCEMELKVANRKIDINMTSDNNQILIGKNGQTLKSLETMVRQFALNKYHYHLSINLDVENYKEMRDKKLVTLAKKLAKEVVATQMEVKLEDMNSYERRIVHNALTDYKGVTTISEGEDPNRHVIIKPIAK